MATNSQNTVDFKRLALAYGGEVRRMEEALGNMFRTQSAAIQTVGRYIATGGGKRIRPLFLLATARMMGYGGEDRILLASVVEAIHTASLLHDDVIDGAVMRRGRPVANSIWGNQVVILVGDYLYSTALKLSVGSGSLKVIQSLSSAISDMTRGELLQLERSGDPAIGEDEYLRIIEAKTGGLISSACRIGAILGKASIEQEEALALFGLKSGAAFQMADDILDYMADEGDLGKRLGADLGEGKITLPLILLLRAVSFEERPPIVEAIENGTKNGGLERIHSLFDRYGVLGDAIGHARGLVDEAKDALSIFPPSQAREDLLDLAEFALVRGK